MSELAEWESFYLIVGGAAGAPHRLAVRCHDAHRRESVASAGRGSGVCHADDRSFRRGVASIRRTSRSLARLHGRGAAVGCVGLGGAAYGVVVARRMQKQAAYQPVLEDWLSHALLPLLAYALLIVSAFAASSHTREALFGIGTAALLLLFIGIHNAWDAVAYLVARRGDPNSPVRSTARSARQAARSGRGSIGNSQ